MKDDPRFQRIESFIGISGMGDGGSDPQAMIADNVRSVIPYVAGWAIMGFVFGLLWWLLGKTLRRP